MPEASTSNWLYTYTKIRFFTRIRRFLLVKAASSKKQLSSSDQFDNKPIIITGSGVNIKLEVPEMQEVVVTDTEKENDQEEDGWTVLQRSVKKLHFGSWEEKELAMESIKKLARNDSKRKKSMAELGVIPPLVSMVLSEVVERQRLAVQTLIELSNGSFTNKALMVEAGILSKLPMEVDVLDGSAKQEFAELLLSISSLSNRQFPVTSSRIVPFITSILESSSIIETRLLCLSILYNLSSVLDNAGSLVSSGVIETLLRLSAMKDASEKALATLGNLVVTSSGRKAVERSQMVPESLIEILSWEDKPKCQELSAYILMILAHQSSVQREKMAKAGIVNVLLEVALLGSPLAQKRALKLLQWFKDERQRRMGPHSGPQQVGRISMGSPVNEREDDDEGRRLMKKIVKQSLHKNMEIITRRASGAEGTNSRLKALIISSSSKSLPY